MHHVVEASHVAGYQLRVVFENGEVRVVDLASNLDGPVFEPLHDIAYFVRFQVNRHTDTVAWPNGADFSPDFLYESGEVVAGPSHAASMGAQGSNAPLMGLGTATAVPYPDRPMAPAWIRYACMAFGAACTAGAISGGLTDRNVGELVGGFLVGAVWFGFGWYGGIPLVGTVKGWRPPAFPDEVNAMHVRGLLLMRRWRRMTWAFLVAFGVMILLIPLHIRLGIPGPVALSVCIVLFASGALVSTVFGVLYQFCRCPRCGYGFFARSTNRAAFFWYGKACRHCGLSLDDSKAHAVTDLGGKAT